MPLSPYQPTDEREDDSRGGERDEVAGEGGQPDEVAGEGGQQDEVAGEGGQPDEVAGEGGQQDVQVYMSVTNVVLGYHLLGLNTLHFCGNAYSNCQRTNEHCSLPYAAFYSLGTAVPLTPPPSR